MSGNVEPIIIVSKANIECPVFFQCPVEHQKLGL